MRCAGLLSLVGSCWLAVGCGDDLIQHDAERALACALLTNGPARPLITTPHAADAPDARVALRLDTTVTASVGGNAGYLKPEIRTDGTWLFALSPSDITWSLRSPGKAEPLLATRTERPGAACGAATVFRHYALETDRQIIRLGPTHRTSARLVILRKR